jgi:hypothetical protein
MCGDLPVDDCYQLPALAAERGPRFLSHHQPVMPVADVVLQLLKHSADGQRRLIFFARLGNITRLLGTLAKSV